MVGTTPIMLKCDKQNLYHLFDFIKTNKTEFELIIAPELSNLLELITTGNIIIYMMMDLSSAEIQSAYFFRKSCTYVAEKSEVLSCFASINGLTTTPNEFIRGFKTAVCGLPEYTFVSMERISHNGIIIENLIKKTEAQISKTGISSIISYIIHSNRIRC